MNIGMRGRTRAVRTALAIASVVVALVTTQAAAATRDPYETGPLGEKHYNPDSKSYFELRSAPPGMRLTWNAANRMARASKYRGVRGRLATVDDDATHAFLRETFFLSEPAWIGLRYWCGVRKLSWADGSVHELTAFKVWARPWSAASRGGSVCGGGALTQPVLYTPHARGFLWQAVPAGAGLRYFFVEYPTGGREPQEADGGDAPAAPSGVQETPQQP